MALTTIITDDEFNGLWVHGQMVTNLGPRFQIDLGAGTCTTLTVQQHPKSGEARIVWINTYGNVTANNDLPDLPGRPSRPPAYAFDAAAGERARRILNLIRKGEAAR